jgi:hypothetical protein
MNNLAGMSAVDLTKPLRNKQIGSLELLESARLHRKPVQVKYRAFS